MSAISQLLLTRFWPNFKGRLRGPSWTDSNCHSDICPGNICPYKEYLSCYWPNFDQTFRTQLFLGFYFLDPKCCRPKIFWIQIFWIQNFFGLKILLTQSFFGTQTFCDPKLFNPKNFGPKILLVRNIFWIKNFRSKQIWNKKDFLDQPFFQSKGLLDQTFWDKIFLDLKLFWTENFWDKYLTYLSAWYILLNSNIKNKKVMVSDKI